MGDNAELIKFLKSIDPDIDIVIARNGYDLCIIPSDDSPLMDSDYICVLPTPQHAQFMQYCVEEFRCIYEYKGTRLGRLIGSYGYWLEHSWGGGVLYRFEIGDVSHYSRLMDFVVMLNDGALPTGAPIEEDSVNSSELQPDSEVYNLTGGQ